MLNRGQKVTIRSINKSEQVPKKQEIVNAELGIRLGKKLSVLEIRDFLSGEFEPVPLADVMGVLRAREAAGTIKLVPRR
jgi:aminopeptidase YwaD